MLVGVCQIAKIALMNPDSLTSPFPCDRGRETDRKIVSSIPVQSLIHNSGLFLSTNKGSLLNTVPVYPSPETTIVLDPATFPLSKFPMLSENKDRDVYHPDHNRVATVMTEIAAAPSQSGGSSHSDLILSANQFNLSDFVMVISTFPACKRMSPAMTKPK